MRFIFFICLLIITKNAFSQYSEVKIVEQLPTCVDCRSIVENYINNHNEKFILTYPDTIVTCFEIDTLGNIQNTNIFGNSDHSLIQVINDALNSVTTWRPARMGAKPINTKCGFRFITKEDRKTVKLQSAFPEITQLKYNTIKENEDYEELFRENSSETIRYLDSWKILALITENIASPKRRFTTSLSKKNKTIKIEGKAIKAHQKCTIIIPEMKLQKDFECDNCSEIPIKEIPIGKEAILIIISQTNENTYFYWENLHLQSNSKLSIVGKEYSYADLSIKINELNQDIKRLWPRR